MMLQFDKHTLILMYLALILFVGYVGAKVANLFKLPNVTGYIVAGILIGPFFLNLIPLNFISNTSFIGDIALSFIAFDVGKFLKAKIFKQGGLSFIVIALFESLLAGLLITLVMFYIFKFSLDFSLLLGAIATATAPASTMMTINQYQAKGKFVDTLLQVVALDNIISLIAFSLSTTFIISIHQENFNLITVLIPIVYNLLVIFIAFIMGVLLAKVLIDDNSANNLVVTITLIIALSSICAYLDISPLLAAMVFGITYINISNDYKVFTTLNNFSPPIFVMFFTLSSIKLNMESLLSLGSAGVVYFIVRIIGKYIGSYLGASVVKTEKNITKYLGLALIPQAGVAIGLAFLAERLLPSEVGSMLLTIILSSSVLYELFGPALAKYALFKSKAIKS